MRRMLLTLALIGGFVAAADVAVAQYYGGVITSPRPSGITANAIMAITATGRMCRRPIRMDGNGAGAIRMPGARSATRSRAASASRTEAIEPVGATGHKREGRLTGGLFVFVISLLC